MNVTLIYHYAIYMMRCFSSSYLFVYDSIEKSLHVERQLHMLRFCVCDVHNARKCVIFQPFISQYFTCVSHGIEREDDDNC